jgi:CDP-glycerol glycerophosphotransferase (TagB/SpsB family)
VPSDRIMPVGLSRYDHLPSFREDFSPSQSRAYLKVPEDYQYYILFDSSYTLRGYLTIREQSQVTTSLLRFAQAHPEVALLIKPHPGHFSGWLESLIDYYSLSNVFLLNKNMLPYHALNAADLLITKFSTIGLEAMLFKKPVVSILLDGEERLRMYGDAVERADTVDALDGILGMLVSDADRRTDWEEKQKKNQESFLKSYFGDSISNSARRGAEVIDKLLSTKNC